MILLPVKYSKTPFMKGIEIPDKTTQVCVCLNDHRWQNCQSGAQSTTGFQTWCRPSWQHPLNIKTFASLAHSAVSEWMLLYCLEWACIPVGKMTIPDCGPAVRSIQTKIAAEKSACLSQAKHLLSILMGINGRAGTGDRGVDWLTGPGAYTAAALHTACTAVYSQHKLLRPACALHQLMCISVLSVCTEGIACISVGRTKRSFFQFLLLVCACNYVHEKKCSYCVLYVCTHASLCVYGCVTMQLCTNHI